MVWPVGTVLVSNIVNPIVELREPRSLDCLELGSDNRTSVIVRDSSQFPIMGPSSEPLNLPSRPVRRWISRTAWILAVIISAYLGYSIFHVFGSTNQHTVIPGKVFRSAQPSGKDLQKLIRDNQIRTVVNLRGTSQVYDWYQVEARTLHDANVSLEDITLSANRLPPPTELHRLIDVLDHTEYPILIHCKQGADRTGLASAIVQLLYTDADLATARKQLWPIYGHVRAGRTMAIDEFFDLYEEWLTAQGTVHTSDRFRHWALKVYSPGVARSELMWLDQVPNPIQMDKPFSVRVRATNRSTRNWVFKPGNYSGIHLMFVVANQKLEPVHRGQAGLFHATVSPGQSIDLTIVVPPLLRPGRYALVAELANATGASVPIRVNSFVQFGDESIMANVIVK